MKNNPPTSLVLGSLVVPGPDLFLRGSLSLTHIVEELIVERVLALINATELRPDMETVLTVRKYGGVEP